MLLAKPGSVEPGWIVVLGVLTRDGWGGALVAHRTMLEDASAVSAEDPSTVRPQVVSWSGVGVLSSRLGPAIGTGTVR